MDNAVIKNSNDKKLLRVSLNNRLGLDNQVTNICNQVSKKLNVLARIYQFISIHKRRMTMKAYIAFEFGNCPLARMFHGKKLNSRVNKLYERVLRIADQEQKYPVVSY